jgi:Uma2 family endonuclease
MTTSPLPSLPSLAWGARLAVADLGRIPDDGHRYELIDGSLLVTPAPSPAHQTAAFRLARILDDAVNADAGGELAGGDIAVLPAPVNFVISNHDAPQPDVVVAARSTLTERGVEGTPLLVVEVLSPSTRAIDLGAKRVQYEVAEVPRYWIVDPVAPSLTVLELSEGRLVEIAHVRGPEAFEDPRLAVRVVPATLTL